MTKKSSSFSDIINSEKPVLVDFTASWCGPCKMMAPILVDVAKAVGDDARIVKIDIDQNQALATKLNIRSVPTLILYRKGEVKWQHSGVISGAELTKVIQENVG